MIVLDTHIVIWLTIEPRRMPRALGRLVAEAYTKGEGVAIADVTLLELATLAAWGRIRPAIPLGLFLRQVENKFRVLPITGAVAEQVMRFSENYPKDPADRLIGATAVVCGAQLMTRDGAIRRSGEVQCIG
ncbi:MAG TPA: type II toxin-antitoxin system VapC family toxin [Acidobacteriaceae bacterium]|nr:type II toxin-antitoxin system VapC family toxin [Acidobacteriaceae bacterium]